MVTILENPPLLSTVGNPIRFKLRGSTFNEVSSQQCKIAFYLGNGALHPGDYFIFRVGDLTDYKFTVSYTADDSEEIKVNDENLASLREIHDALKSHYFFNENYDLLYSEFDGYIGIEAKSGGENYDIKLLTSSDANGSNVVYIGMRSIKGQDAKRYNPYYIRQTTLRLTPSDSFIGSDQLTADGFGEACCDFSEYLHPSFNFTLNLTLEKGVCIQDNLIHKFACEFSEIYGTRIGKIQRSQAFYAIPGRLDSETYRKHYAENIDLSLVLSHKFMSNYQGAKEVYPGMPEKLFFCTDNSDELLIIAEIDDSQSMLLGSVTKPLDTDYYIFEIDCSMEKVLKATEAKSYKIVVRSAASGEDISEVREFICTSRPYFSKDFLFVNAYGVPECVSFLGVRKEMNSYKRETIEMSSIENSKLPISIKSESVYELSTSFISKMQYRWLKEFQRSLQIWEIVDGDVQRCVLINETTNDTMEGGLLSHTIKYTYTIDNPIIVNGRKSYNNIFDSTFDNTFN